MIRLDILVVQKTKYLWSNLWTTETNNYINHSIFTRWYGMKSDKDRCRRAVVDIPPDADPDCPQPCIRQKKPKKGILHKIKLKVIEGGTNFGTPFRRVQCTPKPCEEVVVPEAKALPPPEKKVIPIPEPRPGLQVSILGADTAIGHYVALLLKQCPCIKKLRLYEAKDTQYSDCSRDLCKVVQDLQHIDTNCRVQAFSSACYELERCLQTLKETSWYDPRKLLGSLAVPEMRASTLAARALCLEPRYTRVPCVGGTEGMSLVPLFSKAVEYFDFAQHNAQMMTNAVREAQLAVTRCDGSCIKAADLSEAHALAGLVKKVAYALMCQDLSRVTGFVETDASQVISPARYLAIDVLLNDKGICKRFDIPKLNFFEIKLVDTALQKVTSNVGLAQSWYEEYLENQCQKCQFGMQKHWYYPKAYDRINDCSIEM
ncbi:malate dehydrogenase, mitochondrial-like isoform X3 [Achroia grisella]|uniref:malate dehydrogenase, mitochondrial-like isoform X3 n=1 Tax=Achroia grisella TaxID=688607 RepID=UPI0027D32D05|nr:malate dehydrogenase, mitochondrial-like isoform X3 [Achroia grisella]